MSWALFSRLEIFFLMSCSAALACISIGALRSFPGCTVVSMVGIQLGSVVSKSLVDTSALWFDNSSTWVVMLGWAAHACCVFDCLQELDD
jgi:hypothetical protein